LETALKQLKAAEHQPLATMMIKKVSVMINHKDNIINFFSRSKSLYKKYNGKLTMT